MRAFVVGGLVLAGVLLPAASAQGADRVVDYDKVQCPTAPFSSIQTAVDAASPGDRVLVCDGVYNEAVTINKSNLRLVAHVVQAAIIQAPVTGAPNGIVHVTGAGVSGVEVSRFVIQKGPLSGAAAAGIHVDNGASLKISRHNLIRRIDDAGIRVNGTAPDIAYNRIQEYGNGAGVGDGIQVSGVSSATMSFNTIVGASAASGIIIIGGAKGSAIGNRISGNASLGGIALVQSLPSGVGSVIKGNQVFDNIRGIWLSDTTGALVASNRLSRNSQEGILASNSGRNTFDRNDARSNGGADCFDNTTGGSGTAGTANTWTFNLGIESIPPGICTP